MNLDHCFFRPLYELHYFQERAEAFEETVRSEYISRGEYQWDAMADEYDTLLCRAMIEVMSAMDACGIDGPLYGLMSDGEEAVILLLMRADPELEAALKMGADIVLDEIANSAVAKFVRDMK